MKRFLMRCIVAVSMVALAGQGCTKGPTQEAVQASRKFELNVWGVVDDFDVYDATIKAYRAAHPNITINYRRFRLEEYEDAIVNALAEDRGPDVFLMHNTWVGKYLPKIAPMPTQTKIGYAITTGSGYNTQTTWEVRTEPSVTLRALRNDFADVVAKDTIRTINVGTADKPSLQERVLGLPISIDTLALYYNKDLLNAAGIPIPPDTWSQFQEQTKKLVKFDENREITQAAVGMGTGFNVERSADILSILMMQNGAEMTNANGAPTFMLIPQRLQDQRDEPPAYQALDFYTSFADPNRENYCWNDKQSNSLQAFIQGKSAFFFGYAYQYPQIRASAPRLNLGISKLPQIENNPVKNFANYWLWTVSKKSTHTNEAWNFINFMTTQDQMKTISNNMGRPAARKALLSDQLENERIGVFASQVLTSDSWYRGNDARAVDAAFAQMIEDVLKGTKTIPNALRFAADQVAQTISY